MSSPTDAGPSVWEQVLPRELPAGLDDGDFGRGKDQIELSQLVDIRPIPGPNTREHLVKGAAKTRAIVSFYGDEDDVVKGVEDRLLVVVEAVLTLA